RPSGWKRKYPGLTETEPQRSHIVEYEDRMAGSALLLDELDNVADMFGEVAFDQTDLIADRSRMRTRSQGVLEEFERAPILLDEEAIIDQFEWLVPPDIGFGLGRPQGVEDD